MKSLVWLRELEWTYSKWKLWVQWEGLKAMQKLRLKEMQ